MPRNDGASAAFSWRAKEKQASVTSTILSARRARAVRFFMVASQRIVAQCSAEVSECPACCQGEGAVSMRGNTRWPIILIFRSLAADRGREYRQQGEKIQDVNRCSEGAHKNFRRGVPTFG